MPRRKMKSTGSRARKPIRRQTRARRIMGGPLMPNPGSLLVGAARIIAGRQTGTLGFGNTGRGASARSRAATAQRSRERAYGEAMPGTPVKGYPGQFGPRPQPPRQPTIGSQLARGLVRRVRRAGADAGANPYRAISSAGIVSEFGSMSRRKPRPRRRGGSARTM